VNGDRDLLMEANVNVVDNAVKFTPQGGRVEISLFRGNAESIVRVKDTGSGISETEREAVLARFYRSDKFRSAPGFGLGLNLVAAIVKLHGFRLTIYPGSGCVIEIASPDQNSKDEAGRSVKSASAWSLAKYTRLKSDNRSGN
jgi:signal transduction histidine kinase